MTTPELLRGNARALLAELGVLAVATLDSLLGITSGGRIWPWVAAALALLGLLVRRRYPVLGFVATLPGLATSLALVATLVTLYNLSRRATNRHVVITASAVTIIGFVAKIPIQVGELAGRETLLDLVYGLLSGAGPAALGQLVRTQEILRRQLRELDDAHNTEQALREQQVLERERNRLAREMHDVVSHQVSLIAVQTGALQVSAPDETIRDTARTIRKLAVSTLDELRNMVEVLRAPGADAGSLQPQPGLAQLRTLVERSEVDVTFDQDPDLTLGHHAQRAIYRTVQEGLTNVRKHAPGAKVHVRVFRDGHAVQATVHNARPTGDPLRLPGSHQGLIGLRERADLVGGTLTAGPDGNGGFQLTLRLPIPFRD